MFFLRSPRPFSAISAVKSFCFCPGRAAKKRSKQTPESPPESRALHNKNSDGHSRRCTQAARPPPQRIPPAPRDIPTCDKAAPHSVPSIETQTRYSLRSYKTATRQKSPTKTIAGNSPLAAATKSTAPPAPQSPPTAYETADALPPAP